MIDSVLNNHEPSLIEMFERKENHRCPFCNKEVKITDFHDNTSIREYQLSGLCPECQGEFFE